MQMNAFTKQVWGRVIGINSFFILNLYLYFYFLFTLKKKEKEEESHGRDSPKLTAVTGDRRESRP